MYILPVSRVKRQKGLTTGHLHIQLDPFASQLMVFRRAMRLLGMPTRKENRIVNVVRFFKRFPMPH